MRGYVFLVLLLIGACQSDSSSHNDKDAEPPEVKPILEEQVQRIDDAKQVEDLAKKRKQEMDAALEEAEGN